MATLLLVAITLIAGFAIYGYVNGQAASSEGALGVANAANVNFLNERFVVVDMAVPDGATSAQIWIYNNGNLTLTIKQIVLYDGTKSNLYAIFNGTAASSGCGQAASPSFGDAGSFAFGSGGTPIAPRTGPTKITLNLPSTCAFSPLTTYHASVLGLYGNVVAYASCNAPIGGCPN